MAFVVLVCGGRDYRGGRDSKDNNLYDKLDWINICQRKITKIIEGGADGADMIGRIWARENGVPFQTFEADWDKYGSAAGPIRNQQMVDAAPDLVVAAPGGRGTADMVRRAKKAGIEVVELQT